MSEELRSRLQADMKVALKGGQAVRVGALRMLLSELRNKEIEKGRELSADEGLALVAAGIKSREESLGQFRGAGRHDLADKEAAEIEVLRGYLPPPLSREELHALVEQGIAETGAASPREIGKVMSWMMPRVRGRAEGGEVSRLVKERLASPGLGTGSGA